MVHISTLSAIANKRYCRNEETRMLDSDRNVLVKPLHLIVLCLLSSKNYGATIQMLVLNESRAKRAIARLYIIRNWSLVSLKFNTRIRARIPCIGNTKRKHHCELLSNLKVNLALKLRVKIDAKKQP